MIRIPQRRLLIFAKAPIPHEVKTRLSPPLHPEQCAQLQAGLLKHTLQLAQKCTLGDITLCCSPNDTHPEFLKLAKEYPVTLQKQQGNTLGERMYYAIQKNLQEKSCIVLIGTDCPLMQPAYIESAFQQLEAGQEIILGPAEDGGYVLIGARKIHTALFQGISWGSNCVLQQTKTRLRTLTLQWRLLEPLWDIDYPDDLIRLYAVLTKMPANCTATSLFPIMEKLAGESPHIFGKHFNIK